ncbi:MAG: hypothetical protein E6I72_08025 [Chloroflexi bacterium]|nr:MAG: hypothetical protein AUI15_30705 [Actinobacteria bacterium 13_2_20CM_2_66_6]TMD96880.1 MAG: hypothetical protein E6I72_08025 [Chloroflexota bacterium]
MQLRFDKHGQRLPDTGRGCGCQQCADADAPRYERREDPLRAARWSPLRRRIVSLVSRVRRIQSAA